MARTTPRVEDDILIDRAGATQPITVGTSAWYAWLERASTFAFTGQSGRFTARKERRGRADGYWRVYRKHAGKLYSAYLGKSADLTLRRLQDVAAALVAHAVEANQGIPPEGSLPERAVDTPAITTPTSTGTVTFLLIDIDSSTTLWAQLPQKVIDFLTCSTVSLEKILTTGDDNIFTSSTRAIGAAFGNPLDAVTTALAIQRALGMQSGGATGTLHQRIALHTGIVTERGDTYTGRALDWALLLLAAGHERQILLSHVTQALVRDQLPADTTLRDLGTYCLGETSHPEHFFQLVTADLPVTFPPLRPPARRPHNLPVPPTPLVGRAQEVAAVMAALQREEVRLLTLTGPGGVGKTRLGLQAATELRDVFADGVFLVDLAALRDPDFVVPAIAQTLGIADVDGHSRLTHLRDYLSSKQLLLFLDNFEQVLPAASDLAALLAAAPEFKLLVTSRAVLHLAGEHEMPVAPLALPDYLTLSQTNEIIRTAALALFIQRAQAVKPDFVVTPETAPVVAEICQRLDGLPLAIELAAARIKLFPPAVLLLRLERRLPLLSGGARDLPARQQTLRDTIDWSYQLLERGTQALLQWLTVFEGGFTLEAAEAVCEGKETGRQGDKEKHAGETACLIGSLSVMDELATLVDQSLLHPATDRIGTPRFTMLETLREYALERLDQSGDAPALRQRHAAYYLRLAEQAEPKLHGTDRRVWLDSIEAEHPNMRAALNWARAQGANGLAARLASSLGVFWDVRHRGEGRDWLAAVLGNGALLEPALRAKALHTAGWLARAQYDQPVAFAQLEESLALYRELGNERGCAATTTDLGWTLATFGRDTMRATALLDEGLARYRALEDSRGIARALHGLGLVEQYHALGDRRGIAWLLTGLGWVEQHHGMLATARALYAKSLHFARAAGDVQAIAWSLHSLGIVAAAQRDYAAARAFQDERLAIERSQDNRYGIASAQEQLGKIALRLGDTAAARAWLVESLHLARAIGDKSVTAFALRGLGEVAHSTEDYVQASVVLEEALVHFRELGDVYRQAQVCAILAQVALDQQDDTTARMLAMQSLELARSVNDPETIGVCLAGLADSAARQGWANWAARLWGAAERQREATQTQRAPVEPVNRPQFVEAARTSLGAAAFAAAWATGRALSPEEALVRPEPDGSPLASIRADELSGRSTPASPHPAGLTSRELEVLLLVAEDLSRTQIAERMVISPATVKTYLSAIYRKLGVTSRMAAMRYVFDHHLR